MDAGEIFMTYQERSWLNNASLRGGSFVKAFAMACFCADEENFRLLKPLLQQMMEKYPRYNEVKEAEG